MSQSSNDTFPTAMSIAAATETARRLLPAVKKLRDVLLAKSLELRTSSRLGGLICRMLRAHLWARVSAWVNMLDRDGARIAVALDGLYDLAIGGTAVGTGLNAHPELPNERRGRLRS